MIFVKITRLVEIPPFLMYMLLSITIICGVIKTDWKNARNAYSESIYSKDSYAAKYMNEETFSVVIKNIY